MRLPSIAPSLRDKKLLVFVAFFLFVLFAFLFVQFYKIQIVEGEQWRLAADRQHYCVVVEPCRRGVFYSNTSIRRGHPEQPQPLVMDVPRCHLYADPSAIPASCRLEIAQRIREVFGLTGSEYGKILESLQKKSRSRKLVLWIDRKLQDVFQNWWQPYARSHKLPRNALFFVSDYQRSYPFGKLLGQILHTVHSEREPSVHRCQPTGGLEYSLDAYLKGEDGKRSILRSPRQSLDSGRVLVEPKHGADVYLTVNHYLQSIAEEEVCRGVKNSRAKSGWAILMNPQTGEIWAWAQYPFFDPSCSSQYFQAPHKEQDTKLYGITDPYEPGSIMKPITLAIALAANEVARFPLFLPEEKIATSTTTFPGRGKPLKDGHPHRFLNMYMGLQKSSNVYMAKRIQAVVETLGDHWYREMLQGTFGFGRKSGIELPGESAAALPRPGKLHPNGKMEWSRATPYSLAMGHNILATSLQMVKAYAMLANGGFEIHPTLIRKIVDPKGNVLIDHTAPSPKKRVLSREVADEVVKAMRFVTQVGGSAKRGGIPGFTEGGKTGTAEKVVGGVYSKKNHISSFIGFAPATNPRFVLLVSIDEPECLYIPGVGRNQMGGVCAAPVFREIGLKTLQYLGEPPDDPNNTAWDEEVRQLKALYDRWNGSGG